jgi:Mg/Co/Ni transporter MgtE
MDKEASEDVRELLEYDDKQVGSIMSTDFIAFNKNITAGQAIDELRRQKPEDNVLYSILATDEKNRLVGTISLRDIVVTDPATPLHSVMDNQFISVFDDDKLGDLAEIVSKYNLLAVPVIDSSSKIQGVVIIDDIVEELVENRKL